MLGSIEKAPGGEAEGLVKGGELAEVA